VFFLPEIHGNLLIKRGERENQKENAIKKKKKERAKYPLLLMRLICDG
jgi:hypothetical protein